MIWRVRRIFEWFSRPTWASATDSSFPIRINCVVSLTISTTIHYQNRILKKCIQKSPDENINYGAKDSQHMRNSTVQSRGKSKRNRTSDASRGKRGRAVVQCRNRESEIERWRNFGGVFVWDGLGVVNKKKKKKRRNRRGSKDLWPRRHFFGPGREIAR